MTGFRSGNPDGFEFKLLVGRGDLVEAATIGQLEISYNFSETFSFQIGSFYDGDAYGRFGAPSLCLSQYYSFIEFQAHR